MDQDRLEAARTASLFYGLFILLLSGVSVIATLSGDDVSAKRMFGHLMLALVVPWIPMAGLAIGRRMVTTAGAAQALSFGIFAAVAFPGLMLVAVLMSREPLAALALLYVPPVQAVGLGVLLGLLGLMKFAKRRDGEATMVPPGPFPDREGS